MQMANTQTQKASRMTRGLTLHMYKFVVIVERKMNWVSALPSATETQEVSGIESAQLLTNVLDFQKPSSLRKTYFVPPALCLRLWASPLTCRICGQ